MEACATVPAPAGLLALVTFTTALAQSGSGVLPPRPDDPAAPAAVAFTYGGSGSDRLNAVAVDAGGNTFIAGFTDSRDLPAIDRAFQKEPRAGNDAFVSKLDASGRPEWSTCIGGNNARGNRFAIGDTAEAVAVDPQGNVYIGGQTYATDFPTANAYLASPQANISSDGFIAKFNPTGSALVYSTYLGGVDGASRVVAIAVGPAGDAWVALSTDARQFRTTRDLSGGTGRLIVLKLTTSGALVWATRLGATGNESLNDMTVDDQGQPLLTGLRPITCPGGAAGGCAEAFVIQLDATGASIIYDVGLRGTRTQDGLVGSAQGTSVASAPDGTALVTGVTSWSDMPLPSAWETRPDGFFTARLSPSGQLELLSYGGGLRIATDLRGSLHLGRNVSSDGQPVVAPIVSHYPDLPVFVSPNRGETWLPSSAGVDGGAAMLAFGPAQDVLYLAGTTGLFRSADRATRWTRVAGLPLTFQGNALGGEGVSVDPQDGNVVYAASGSLYRSTDGGTSWTLLRSATPGATGFSTRLVAVSPHDRSVWIATNDGVEVSTDGGRTWSPRNEGLRTFSGRVASPYLLVFDPIRPGVVLGGFTSGLYGWFSDGEGWEELTRNVTHPDTNIPEEPLITSIALDPTTGRRIYAGTFNRGVLKTDDGGVTWTRALANTPIVSLAVDPDASHIVYASIRQSPSPGARIVRSLDRGETWTAINSGLTLRQAPNRVYADPRVAGRLFAVNGSQLEVPYVARFARTGPPLPLVYRLYVRLVLPRCVFPRHRSDARG